jgi:Cu/Ag efflux pump CusA
MKKLKFPAGYTWEEGSVAEVAARNTSCPCGVFLLAIFGISGVLVATLRRFREVAVLAGVIPLGRWGGLLELLLTGNSLSFLAVIGFVAEIGIEIKNSILAGQLHDAIARSWCGTSRFHRKSRRDALSVGTADVGRGDRWIAPARAFGSVVLRAARPGDHGRGHFVDAA